MIRITFNTPPSNRVTQSAKALINGAWATSAGLKRKQKTVSGWIDDHGQIDFIVSRLKALKCTKIELSSLPQK